VARTFPSSAPIDSTLNITVLGSDFFASESIYCKFGDQQVKATWINNAHINCTCPSVSNAEVVPLEISVDGMTWVSAGSFRFYGAQPSSLEAPARIRIYACVCTHERASERASAFSIVLMLRILFYPLSTVQPTIVSFAPLSGNPSRSLAPVVNLTGTDFWNSTLMSCMYVSTANAFACCRNDLLTISCVQCSFGETRTTAVFVSPTFVQCLHPHDPTGKQLNVTVGFSQNGLSIVYAPGVYQFEGSAGYLIVSLSLSLSLSLCAYAWY